MNLHDANALCMALAQEIRNAANEQEPELAAFMKIAHGTAHDPISIKVCDSKGTPFCDLAVVRNCNPSNVGQYAVVQEDGDTCETWVHVSPDVCFTACI